MLLLSDRSVDGLVVAAMNTYGQGDGHRRAAAREAVVAAADQLGLDPRRPPYEDDQPPLHEAVRVLGFEHAAKALEEYRRCRAACDELAQRFAALRRRRDELQIGEVERLREQLSRGRMPQEASEKLKAELGEIRAKLDTIGDHDVSALIPRRPDQAVLEEAFTEPQWLSVCFYLHLLGDHLKSVVETQSGNRNALNAALAASAPARGYEKTVSANPARFSPEHDRSIRSIRWCVHVADLHGLRAVKQAEDERTLAELRAAEAAAGRPVAVP